MSLFLLALAPVIIIAGYIYFRDKYEREPLHMLVYALFFGGIIVIPVYFVERYLSSFSHLFSGLVKPVWDAFIVASFTEELFKFLALYILIWKSPAFNEKFDGIVYAVFVSLGFAAVENVLYVLGNGYETGIMRAVTAVPAHAIFGVTMGFYFGLAKFYHKERYSLKLKAFFYPLMLHGIYDFIIMTGIKWLTGVFFLFVIFLYIFGFKRIKKLSERSIYRTDYTLLNQKLSKQD